MKLKSLDYVDIIESFTNRYEHIVKKVGLIWKTINISNFVILVNCYKKICNLQQQQN